jgi:hypothetical protein
MLYFKIIKRERKHTVTAEILAHISSAFEIETNGQLNTSIVYLREFSWRVNVWLANVISSS